MNGRRLLAALLLAVPVPAPARASAVPPELAGIPARPYELLERQAHDPSIFLQGLAFHGEQLLESGGGYRHSRLVLRELRDPVARNRLNLPRNWFAEGLAVLGDRAIVLTWQEGIAQEYRLPGLERGRRWRYAGEGWGLTSDGRALIQSDGSASLRWRDPETFEVQRRLTVTAAGHPLALLNELEWVEGLVLANIWLSDQVVAIDPADGQVRWRLDLSGLLSPGERRTADVTNGLAWQASTRTLWVSGKNWPWLFALRLGAPQAPPAAAH